MAEMIVLRIVHILGGIFWVGSGLFTTFFLAPALSTTGPAAAQLMGALQKRKLFTVLPIVAVLTILSGLRLMWLTSGGFAHEYFRTTRGATFAAAGTCAILAFLLSLLIIRPATLRATRLALSGGAETEVQRLRRRAESLSGLVGVLLLLGAAGMAAARYLP